MKTSPPPADRRKFASAWDEIRYLYDKLLYWLYQRGKAGKASVFAKRLAPLLATADPKREAILGAECRSLICEVGGDILSAIDYRQHEIELMRRLLQISRNNPKKIKEFALKGRNYGDLSDRLDILATLLHESGSLNKAIRVLYESKEICRVHRIKFDGEEMLREYLEEMKSQRNTSAVNGATKTNASKRLRA